MSDLEKLTPKQLKFIDEYLIDLNATAAYVRAGYAPKLAHTNAVKLLQITTIKNEIDLRKAQLATKAQVTREELIKDLLEIKDNCKSNFPPSAIKAIEVIAKMLGLNEPDKIDHTTNGENLNEINLNINIKNPE